MDRPLIRRLMVAAGSVVLAGGATGVQAADPTRPPPGLVATPVNPGATGAAGAAQPDAATLPSLHLHAILRPSGRPPVAMINDWTMRVGDRFEDVRLVAIGTTHADVVAHGQRVRLSLTPDASHRLRPGDGAHDGSIEPNPSRNAARTGASQKTKKQPAKES